MIIRSIKCDSCGLIRQESGQGGGFSGWGQINGVALNGIDNPEFCPECLGRIMEYIDGMTK